MRNCFTVGDSKRLHKQVAEADTARFETGQVHPFYSTFALGRDAEWACRQFVLEMKEDGEEGIGTRLVINHKAPALVGSNLVIEAIVTELSGNRITCSYRVMEGDRLIADGLQEQRILKTDKIKALVQSLI